MSRRTQIVLDDEQYALLKEESRRSGVSLGALVRAAVDQRFGRARGDVDAALDALDRSAGIWDLDGDGDGDGERYVHDLRRGRWREDEPTP
ncbi:MAG: ribbon-helix-helix protein, CopG family [Actinomycetota bacterium]|jgi:hypothetical protein|nr:ribbon-helix-helix protein, CopG family [Actinomycetota bacterium]